MNTVASCVQLLYALKKDAHAGLTTVLSAVVFARTAA
jgi:hypothetical protein